MEGWEEKRAKEKMRVREGGRENAKAETSGVDNCIIKERGGDKREKEAYRINRERVRERDRERGTN